MVEGIAFFAVTAAIAVFVTLWAARRTVRVRPDASFGRHVACALLAFPAVAVMLFALATAVALVDGARVHEPGPGAGMAIFALVFFLVYALAIGAVVGLPTALLAVRASRNR